VLPRGDAGAGIAIFALAGLGCSALLPLTISFGEKDLAAMSAAVAPVRSRHPRPLTQDAVSPHPAEHGSQPHPNPP
jgi:hypothetical protein